MFTSNCSTQVRLARVFPRAHWWLALVIGIVGIAASLPQWPIAKAVAQSKTGLTPQTTTIWAPLGFGLNNVVREIAVNGTDVYAAGDFTAICGNAACDTGNTPVNHIAKWDGTQWTPLAFGLNGLAGSIVVHDNKVYVAGPSKICADAACSTGTDIQGLAVWDGGSWSAPFQPRFNPNSGTCCSTLAFLGNDLYVGGSGILINPSDTTDTDCALVKLSGGVWSGVANRGLANEFGNCATKGSPIEVGSSVTSLLVVGNDLYVGGHFSQTVDSPDTQNGVKDLNNIAILKGGTTWQALPGKGLVATPNFDSNGHTGSVNSFGLVGTDVYAGGAFVKTFDGSMTLNGVARFSSGAFFTLPNNGLNNQVTKLAVRGNDLFAIGDFSATADGDVTGLGHALDGVGWLSNGAWAPLGNGFLWPGHSAGAVLMDIAVSDNKVYIGGAFTQNGDNSAPGMNNIAQLAPVVTTQLEMTKTADQSQAIVGENLTYTILIKNKGPDIASAVTLTDPLTNNVTFVSASSTQGTCSQSSGPIICNIGDLANGATATATIVVTPNVVGSITNIATVSAANAASVQGQANSSVSPATGTVQFSAASFTVGEGDQRANINVTRSGDTTAAATVDYATSDTAGSNNCNIFNGAASSRCDYLMTLGTLHFAAGETAKVISIPIIDDAYPEGNETFAITLSNALGNGMGLGTPAKATITITDNDTAAGSNPIDNSRSFVRLHYLDFLNREPDQSGWDFWTNNINGCMPQPACLEVQRINTSAAFFLSIEFQQTGYLVYRIYKTAYGNISGAPVPIRFNEFLSETQQIAQGVVVGQSGWDTLLESNKQSFTSQFVQRSRFTRAFPTSMTPLQFVDQLFSNAAMTPTTTDRNTAINEFGAATTTTDVSARSRALRDVTENATLNMQEFNRAFVLMEYFGYLRRNPNDAPDTDFSGYNFWLTKLNQFNGNYISAEMAKAFIISSEYRQRFGP